jgi:uncharacterized protein YegJ (DUF2314 family)
MPEPDWSLPEPEPTNVVALWADVEAPTVTEVLAGLSASGPGSVEKLEDVEHDDQQVAWSIATRWPTIRAPIVLWAEPAQPMDERACAALQTPACKWIVGAETLLDPSDPLTEYTTLMQGLARGLSAVPAVLDVNTTRWFPRHELEAVFGQDIEPPVDVLWVVQGVRAEREEIVWLHTHGLWRCGTPELEMLEVPVTCAGPAAELMNDVASLIIEQSPPAPGATVEIGTELRVTLQPWQHVVQTVAEGIPGGPQDRVDDGENAHVGARAVICAEHQAGAYRKVWQWPEEVTRQLMRDEAGIYRSRRETERQGRLARSAWDQLATAFAAAHDRVGGTEPTVVFVVKAGFPHDDDASSREHLWFEVERFEGARLHGRLVNQPVAVRRLSKGDCSWIDREHMSDWRVVTPGGSYGPAAVEEMWRAIDALAEQPSR